jgi:hypothetical protein
MYVDTRFEVVQAKALEREHLLIWCLTIAAAASSDFSMGSMLLYVYADVFQLLSLVSPVALCTSLGAPPAATSSCRSRSTRSLIDIGRGASSSCASLPWCLLPLPVTYFGLPAQQQQQNTTMTATPP